MIIVGLEMLKKMAAHFVENGKPLYEKCFDALLKMAKRFIENVLSLSFGRAVTVL